MIKECIILVTIVTSIILGNILAQEYTNKSVLQMNQYLYELRTEVLKKEETKVDLNNQIMDIHSKWDEMYQKMAYYVEHNELEKIETELSAISGNIEVKEYEQAIPQIDICMYILEHIKEKAAFKIQNIF